MKRLLQQQQQPPPPLPEDTVAVCFYGNDNPDADSDDADNFYGDHCCKDSGIAHHPTKQQPKRKNRTWDDDDDDDDDNSQIERYHDGDYYCRVDDGRRCHSARIIIPPPPPPPTSSSSLSCSEFNIRTPQRTSIRWWLLPHQCRTRKEYHPRRRRWWSIPFPRFVLLFILLWNVIMIRGTTAEDASSSAYNSYYYSNNNYNNNDDDDNDNTASSTSTTQQQQQPILNPIVTTNYCTLTSSSSSSSYPNNQNYRITVSLLSVLCDTPGAYYSGSTAYRNSPVCVAGDKVKLDIVCTLREDCFWVLYIAYCIGWFYKLTWFSNSLSLPKNKINSSDTHWIKTIQYRHE
jgi:hypothetical protein